jgi:hypothetical protein
MNKRMLLVLPISLSFIACESVDPLSGMSCSAHTGPKPPCEGSPNNEVTINTNTWVVTPRCINADRKETIVFKLVPKNDIPLGSTAILPKNLSDTWLTGVNNSSDSAKISIPVPDWVALGERSYSVLKSNGDCLDPRVHIVK